MYKVMDMDGTLLNLNKENTLIMKMVWLNI